MADSVNIPTSLPIKVQVGHTQYDVTVVDGKPVVTLPVEHVAYLAKQAAPSTPGIPGYAGTYTANVAVGGVDLNAPEPEQTPAPDAGN